MNFKIVREILSHQVKRLRLATFNVRYTYWTWSKANFLGKNYPFDFQFLHHQTLIEQKLAIYYLLMKCGQLHYIILFFNLNVKIVQFNTKPFTIRENCIRPQILTIILFN